MGNGHLVTALDVGTTKVCAIVAEVGADDKPNILGVGVSPCTGVKKGVVVDISATTSAIQDAVDKAETVSGEEVHSVLVGITGEHIACQNSRSVVAISRPGRTITESDVEEALHAAKVLVLPPDREILHSIPRWYSVDGQPGVETPVGMYGTRLEVETHVVTGLSSFVRNVVKCVNEVGLAVDGTVLQPLATSESVLLPAEKDLGVAMVDIGGGTSDLAIYMEGRVYYCGAVPVGGDHVSRDIAVLLRTTVEEAERVKIAHGHALVDQVSSEETFEVTSLGSNSPRQLPRKVLAEIIEPRVAEICQLVMRQIEKAGCEGRIPAGVVFTGGGSQLRGFAELAAKEIGLAVRMGAPTGVSGVWREAADPSYATAVGLVLFWATYCADEWTDHEDDGLLVSMLARIREFLAGFGRD